MVDPKVMTARKEKIIHMTQEAVLDSISCASSQARLFHAPRAVQSVNDVLSKMPVPCFGTKTLSRDIASNDVLLVVKRHHHQFFLRPCKNASLMSRAAKTTRY